MATSLDTKLRPKVLAVIAQYGKAVSFAVDSGGTHSASTGTVSGTSTTTYSVTVTPPAPYASKFIDGDTIRDGDALIYLAAQDLAFTPAAGQRVTIDSAVWTVTRANAIYSGELVCAWEVGLRR